MCTVFSAAVGVLTPAAALLSSLCVFGLFMMSGFGVSAAAGQSSYIYVFRAAEITWAKIRCFPWTGAGCLYHFASQSLCNLSEWIFIFFYSITCDYGIFRSAIGERKSNTNCIREEKKSYKRSCWDMVSGLLETIATESVFAIMADAIDGMVLL